MSLDLIQNFVENHFDAVVAVDTDLKVVAWSSAMPTLIGAKRRTFDKMAQRFFDETTISPDDAGHSLREAVKQFSSDSRPFQLADVRLNFEGRETPGVWCSFIRFGTWKLCFFRDVSAEMFVQSEFRRLLEAEQARGRDLEQQVLERTQELEHALKQVTKLSRVDGLTGLLNRRALQGSVEERLKLAVRRGDDASFVILDLDHFKRVNDNWGHQTGDAVLRHVSACLQECVREIDIVGRIGGEEFCAFLSDCDRAGAEVVAERIRLKIMNNPTEIEGKKTVPVTVSIGVALYGSDGQSFNELFAVADERLYIAKNSGRNKIVSAGGK